MAIQHILAVVMSRVQMDVATQLNNPNIFRDVLAEACMQDFALARLQTVDQRGNSVNTTGDQFVDQLLIDEVAVRQLRVSVE